MEMQVLLANDKRLDAYAIQDMFQKRERERAEERQRGREREL